MNSGSNPRKACETNRKSVPCAMSEDEILKRTQDAYLCLIHPERQGGMHRPEIESVVALAPSVSNDVIAAMIVGRGWRERLLGLCLAMTKRSAAFIEPMVQSLRDPRGISIVPTCAALAVLARRGIFMMPQEFSEIFDRQVFDGEVGWAADKAMHFAGLRAVDVSGRGPNYGQDFEVQVEFYSWIFRG